MSYVRTEPTRSTTATRYVILDRSTARTILAVLLTVAVLNVVTLALVVWASCAFGC